MDNSKMAYLESIRAQSAYPVYRAVIELLVAFYYVLGTIGACLCVGQGVYHFLLNDIFYGSVATGGGLLAGLITVGTGRLLKEVALMLVDMVDTTLETNAHSGKQQAAKAG